MSVLGNRAAAIRAGASRREADEAAGGRLYTEHLPMPAASSPRELVAKTHDPSTMGIDYFQMKSEDGKFEGFLMLIQPVTYFIKLARVKKRSSKVSELRSRRRIRISH